jgi:hypothetical protein
MSSSEDPRTTSWPEDELASIGAAEELDVASRRPDGNLRPFVTIWVVRSRGGLYVRSVKGRSGAWFRGALESGDGRIRAGGREREVRFEQAEPAEDAAVTAAYHAKYDRYGPSIVSSVVSTVAAAATLRLVPR